MHPPKGENSAEFDAPGREIAGKTYLEKLLLKHRHHNDALALAQYVSDIQREIDETNRENAALKKLMLNNLLLRYRKIMLFNDRMNVVAIFAHWVRRCEPHCFAAPHTKDSTPLFF